MKKNKAFTFVELLVVVSILSIISVFSATSFMNFYKNQEFLTKIKNIETIIKNEDTKVITKEIFDYKAVFEKGKNYFLISKDISFLGNYVKLDNLNFDGKFKNFSVKIYENNRFLKEIPEEELNFFKDETEFINKIKELKLDFTKNNYEFDFFEFDNEKYEQRKNEATTQEQKKLIFIESKNKSYSILYNNFSKDEEYKLKLVNISREIEITKDSETPINTGNKLEIENIGGKKSFKLDEKNIKKVYLFFENEETGQIKYLQLNKD